MEYKITNKNLEVVFSTLGAEMISVKYKGIERLWQNDNNTWTGHAPVLFPIAGRIGVVIDGVRYDMKQHGFARRQEFDLLEMKDNKISFILKDNESTHEVYPYKFNLVLTYLIEDPSITLTYEIINTDSKDIYASIGGHTSFALNETVHNYNLIMKDDKEIYSIKLHDNLNVGDKELVSKDGVIDLSSHLLENAETIIMESPKSHKVSLVSKSGEKVVDVEFENLDHLLLWHPLNSKMICIEPWHNLLDNKIDDTEFKDKPGVMKIEKESKVSFIQKYTYY